MSSELLAGALAFLVFLLVLRAFAGRSGSAPASLDDAGDARRYIDGKIDEHLESLAKKYVGTQDEVRSAGDRRIGVDPFAPEIEAFIGEVLERDEGSSHPDGDVMDISVREFLVLEREYVYRRINDRLREHLAAAS